MASSLRTAYVEPSPTTTARRGRSPTALELAEPVAVTLVRRGYRHRRGRARVPRGRRDARPVRVRRRWRRSCETPARGRRGRAADHRPRRLRRRRGLLDRDPGLGAARAGRRVRLAASPTGWRRLRAQRRRASSELAAARHRAADHRRLRDRLGRRGRRAARAAGIEVIVTDHHEPPERAARLPDPAPGRLAAIRSASSARTGGRPQARLRAARRGRSRRRGAATPTSTWSRWRRSPTWSRWSARTAAWCARGSAALARRAAPGTAGADGGRAARARARSTRATSASASRRGSTPPGASTAPTPGSS